MNKVVHFEIPADDLKRAQNFYKEVFDWKINHLQEMNYTILHTGPTDKENMPEESGFINGGMSERKYLKNLVITIDVEDIDEAVKKIEEHGGELIQGKMEIPDMGWTAYFKDSEGNLVGLWQNKTK